VIGEIALLLAQLDLKHENELKEFKNSAFPVDCSDEKSECLIDSDKQESCADSERVVSDSLCDADGLSDKNLFSVKGTQKLSKAQKRRNKKAALEKEREKFIAEQAVENLNGLRHLESEQIKAKLSKRNLSIYEIPPDGNCLYKAIEHQLSILNLKQLNVQTLREETSKYMLSHMADFMPFLAPPESEDIFSEEMYMKYCEDIAKTSVWGGHIEVQALSHVCGVPIEIIQAEGPNIISGDENSNPKLILSYHRFVFGLGEHYNSVVPAA